MGSTRAPTSRTKASSSEPPPRTWSSVPAATRRPLAITATSMAGNELAAAVLSAEELETLKALLRRVINGLAAEEEDVP
jgi:hypothetical protein